MRAKTLRFPDLKLVSKADEGCRLRDAGVGLQLIRQDHPPLAVDLQCLAGSIKRDQKFLARVRIRRITSDQAFDVRQQRIAAGIDRRLIECWIAVESFESVAHEHPPERRRNRDPPLGIEPQRVVRHEAVHPHSTLGYAPARPPSSPPNGRPQRWLHSMGNRGIPWEIMGVNGPSKSLPTQRARVGSNELAAARLKETL